MSRGKTCANRCFAVVLVQQAEAIHQINPPLIEIWIAKHDEYYHHKISFSSHWLDDLTSLLQGVTRDKRILELKKEKT